MGVLRHIVYCFSLPDGNITAYQSPVMIGTNIKELKLPPNDPVGQRAYNAVAKVAEESSASLTISPSPALKRRHLRKRWKSVSVNKHAASTTLRRRVDAEAEACRMVMEKVLAAGEAQATAAASSMRGRKKHIVVGKALKLDRKRPASR